MPRPAKTGSYLFQRLIRLSIPRRAGPGSFLRTTSIRADGIRAVLPTYRATWPKQKHTCYASLCWLTSSAAAVHIGGGCPSLYHTPSGAMKILIRTHFGASRGRRCHMAHIVINFLLLSCDVTPCCLPVSSAGTLFPRSSPKHLFPVFEAEVHSLPVPTLVRL